MKKINFKKLFSIILCLVLAHLIGAYTFTIIYDGREYCKTAGEEYQFEDLFPEKKENVIRFYYLEYKNLEDRTNLVDKAMSELKKMKFTVVSKYEGFTVSFLFNGRNEIGYFSPKAAKSDKDKKYIEMMDGKVDDMHLFKVFGNYYAWCNLYPDAMFKDNIFVCKVEPKDEMEKSKIFNGNPQPNFMFKPDFPTIRDGWAYNPTFRIVTIFAFIAETVLIYWLDSTVKRKRCANKQNP